MASDRAVQERNTNGACVVIRGPVGAMLLSEDTFGQQVSSAEGVAHGFLLCGRENYLPEP